MGELRLWRVMDSRDVLFKLSTGETNMRYSRIMEKRGCRKMPKIGALRLGAVAFLIPSGASVSTRFTVYKELARYQHILTLSTIQFHRFLLFNS